MENLDPKAVFANERTLLHYAEKGMQLDCYLFGAVCSICKFCNLGSSAIGCHWYSLIPADQIPQSLGVRKCV